MSNSAKYRRKISKLISVNCISPVTFFPINFWTCKDTLTFESTQDSTLSKSSEVEIFRPRIELKFVLPATGVISFI